LAEVANLMAATVGVARQLLSGAQHLGCGSSRLACALSHEVANFLTAVKAAESSETPQQKAVAAPHMSSAMTQGPNQGRWKQQPFCYFFCEEVISPEFL
jgi:hypothetical protein